jgi:hypothetical protein
MYLHSENTKRKPAKGRNVRGFSLVEVLIAGSIITLSLLSTVAFIRKGEELLAVDKHRRMARAIIERTLEGTQYQVDNYNNLVTTPSPPPPATAVVIDADAIPNLLGSLAVSVGPEQTGVNGQTAPYRAITAWVTWTEPGGGRDTVSIEQWLTNIQRN